MYSKEYIFEKDNSIHYQELYQKINQNVRDHQIEDCFNNFNFIVKILFIFHSAIVF